jgi:putative endonuclease
VAELVDLPTGRQARWTQKMYYVNAIKSIRRNYIYVELTGYLEERFKRHNDGHEKTTKQYAPFDLIYTEQCDTRENARKREKYLKSGCGKEFLKNI